MPELKHPESSFELLQIWVECTGAKDVNRLIETLKTMTPRELELAGETVAQMVTVIADVYVMKVAEQ